MLWKLEIFLVNKHLEKIKLTPHRAQCACVCRFFVFHEKKLNSQEEKKNQLPELNRVYLQINSLVQSCILPLEVQDLGTV